ncbi:MAG: hypothetical protein ACLQBL_39955 [Polyangiaceae bacterium]
MSRRLTASVLVSLSLALAACHRPPPKDAFAGTPQCADSHEDNCSLGRPLCMVEETNACVMCRCDPFPALGSDRPHDPRALATATFADERGIPNP